MGGDTGSLLRLWGFNGCWRGNLSPVLFKSWDKRGHAGFKKSGLALDDKDLEKFKEIAKQKSVNAINFSKNIRDYKDYLDVTEEELEGLPEDFKNKLQKIDGKYRVTLDYPDYGPFMLNAVKDEPRKILEYKYSRRGGEEIQRALR